MTQQASGDSFLKLSRDLFRQKRYAEAAEILQIMLEKVKAKYPNCKMVVAGMLAPPNLGAAYTNAFRDMYPALAKSQGATPTVNHHLSPKRSNQEVLILVVGPLSSKTR